MEAVEITIALPAWLPLNLIYFMVAGLCGLAANYANLRGKRIIKGSLYRYLIVDRPGRTLASVLALLAAGMGAIAVGGLEDMKITTAVAAGFMSGWAIDAGVNKGDSQ